MKYLYLVLILSLSNSLLVNASELGKVEEVFKVDEKIVFINYRFKTNSILSSDSRFLIVQKKNEIKLYEQNDGNFIFLNELILDEVPHELLVSNSGYVISYGGSSGLGGGSSQLDLVYIYDKEGKLIRKIEADNILSTKQIELVKSKYKEFNVPIPIKTKPWLCYSDLSLELEEPDDGPSMIVMYDALSNFISIDVTSGEIKNLGNRPGACDMYQIYEDLY